MEPITIIVTTGLAILGGYLNQVLPAKKILEMFRSKDVEKDVGEEVIKWLETTDDDIRIFKEGTKIMMERKIKPGKASMEWVGKQPTITAGGTAIGSGAEAKEGGVAIGPNAKAEEDGVALGENTSAGPRGVAIGPNAKAR